ncbi:MAG: type II 3-dehydroquinate dehydratase [Rhodospirillaceae bacterium]|nr:type II 3-dehydroquinate dehydratase [Rhodospirillaceae bacterium]
MSVTPIGKILVINGPNLNLLGKREPDVYGAETLASIEDKCKKRASVLDLEIEFRQSNTEGEMVDWVQQAEGKFDVLIINAGAYTHTSVALLDAIKGTTTPVIEVHLSNIHQREEFRHHSFISKAAKGMICGFGGFGYEMALDAASNILKNR